jgi:hypothetical protein
MTTRHKIGQVPDGRIAIVDAAGNIRGHVGPRVTAITARRFGVRNAELKKVNGRLEWHGESPSRRQRPKPETKNHKAARGSVAARE